MQKPKLLTEVARAMPGKVSIYPNCVLVKTPHGTLLINNVSMRLVDDSILAPVPLKPLDDQSKLWEAVQYPEQIFGLREE